MDVEDFSIISIIIFIIVFVILAASGMYSDPEFEKCNVEIITIKKDTIKLDSCYLEIEGWNSSYSDDILIIKGLVRYKIADTLIEKMTIEPIY